MSKFYIYGSPTNHFKCDRCGYVCTMVTTVKTDDDKEIDLCFNCKDEMDSSGKLNYEEED